MNSSRLQGLYLSQTIGNSWTLRAASAANLWLPASFAALGLTLLSMELVGVMAGGIVWGMASGAILVWLLTTKPAASHS